MADEWMDGMIRRPKKEYLDRSEFRRLFGLSEEMLDDYVNSGCIPEPVKVNSKTILFTWRHAVILSCRIEMRWFPPSENVKSVK